MAFPKNFMKGGPKTAKKTYGDPADSPGQDENKDGVFGGKAPVPGRPKPKSLAFKGLEQAAKKK